MGHPDYHKFLISRPDKSCSVKNIIGLYIVDDVGKYFRTICVLSVGNVRLP